MAGGRGCCEKKEGWVEEVVWEEGGGGLSWCGVVAAVGSYIDWIDE